MKKILLFCFCAIIMAIIPLKSTKLYNLISIDNAETNFYLTKAVAAGELFDVVIHGNGAIVSCLRENAQHVDNLLPDIRAESISFSGDENAFFDVVQKLNGKVIMCENVIDTKVIYGYSNRLGKGILIDGENINFQIALSENRIIVGTPIIFGSF